MRNILFLTLLTVFSLTNCDDNELEGGFEMNYIEDFEIFAGLNTLDTHVFEFTLNSNFQNYLIQKNLTEDNIEAIIPKYVRLTNLSNTLEYNVLYRARLNILKTSGELEFEAAYREPIPINTGFNLELIPTSVEVSEQLKSNQFKLKLKLNFSEIPSISIDTRMFVTFQVVTK